MEILQHRERCSSRWLAPGKKARQRRFLKQPRQFLVCVCVVACGRQALPPFHPCCLMPPPPKKHSPHTPRCHTTGVMLRGGSSLQADLVVDCSGRQSKMPQWLEAAGLPAPRVSQVNASLGYASWCALGWLCVCCLSVGRGCVELHSCVLVMCVLCTCASLCSVYVGHSTQ